LYFTSPRPGCAVVALLVFLFRERSSMGVLSSRNGSSEGWFTLQDEPVVAVAGEGDGLVPQRRRGRGLAKLIEPATQPAEPLAVEGSVSAPACADAQFTRRTPIERLNARASRTLAGIASTRYGALALTGVVLLLVALVVGFWTAGTGSDPAVIRRDQAQIDGLAAERAQALAAASRAESDSARADAELAHWRSVALAEETAQSAQSPGGTRHETRMGGGR
jgi:hypothetical protein